MTANLTLIMIFLLSLLLFFSFPVQSEVFQWVDGKGQRHFSDKPHPGAKVLLLNAGYSYYAVKKVYDGDTILLTNGKKVRFLGINTPEVAGRNKEAQAGGDEAKRWLSKQLQNKKVRLETDVEKKDKYGRLLAHVFTEDKLHLNLLLVKKGLAAVSIYPPNLNYSKALVNAQQHAENNQLGIWQYKDYAPKAVNQIKGGSFKGWQRVVGRVKNIRYTRKYSYLNLSDSFGLKIAHQSAKFFPKLEGYLGQQIEARGWINKHKDRYSLLIRHPSALVTLN